ncbi:MAG: hypothetical protein AAF800_14505, partial [Planctomycetota bacterium]
GNAGPGPGGAFQQDNNFNGIVSIEAENFDNNTSAGVHSWVSRSGGSDGTHMEAGPDNDINRNLDYIGNSPRLDYRINFKKTGTHYVWVRGRAGGSPIERSDSVHVGLNGNAVSTSERISGWGPGFGWENDRMNNVGRATINVTSTGVQTLNVWMREDGFDFDKIFLTTNPNYGGNGNGLGTGPAESDRSGQGGGAPSGATTALLQAETFDGIGTTEQQWRSLPEGSTQFVEVESGSGYGGAGGQPTLTKTLSGMQAGTYRIDIRADTNGNSGDDSFWLRVSNSQTNNGGYRAMTPRESTNNQFFNGFRPYIYLADNGTGDLRVFTLTDGDNTIEIANREDDFKLDWIRFVKV